ncbi:MAG: signal peptidase I [Candidatus Izemoplasmatales bacterium]
MENTDLHLNEYEKLMKKTKRRLISFFFINILIIVLFIHFQSNPLFLFRFNRSVDSVSAYGSYQLISMILLAIVFLYLISYLGLIGSYIYNRKKDVDKEKFIKSYNFFDFFSIIPIFFLIMMTLNGWLFTLAVVDGASMEPTYETDDVVLISYHTDIERLDVIVFEYDKLYIKRVLAIPGDLLVIENNEVWVNDVFIESTTYAFTYDGIIEEGYYFVLGDNRFNSRDSRDIGLISKEQLIGEVILDLN